MMIGMLFGDDVSNLNGVWTRYAHKMGARSVKPVPYQRRGFAGRVRRAAQRSVRKNLLLGNDYVSADELLGKGNVLTRNLKRGGRLVKKVALAPITVPANIASKVVRKTTTTALTYGIRKPMHFFASGARGVGGSVFGTVRSVGRSAAEAAPGIVAGVMAYKGMPTGGLPFDPFSNMPGGMPPGVDSYSGPGGPTTPEEVVKEAKSNLALYGLAGGGALLIGGLLLLTLGKKKKRST